jgi:integrase
VAPKSVGDYFERIREATREYRRQAAEAEGAETPEVEFRPEDQVFTTITGEPAKSLYQAMIEDLLIKAKLREGASGLPRSTYCFGTPTPPSGSLKAWTCISWPSRWGPRSR